MSTKALGGSANRQRADGNLGWRRVFFAWDVTGETNHAYQSGIAAVCAATIALTATSASAYEPQSNTVAKERPKAEKKICRWLPVTGSNFNQKVCLTPEDWKKAEALSW